jgi:glycosyltransferase involved in cell wall biosynthesis
MRFHIPSIPHTITSKEHSACAFTQNIVNFCAMMSRRGHEIIHYGHRNSKVECAELVSVIEPETYDIMYGNVFDIRKNQYTILSDDSDMYSLIAGNTIYEISKRKKPGDFLLLFGGFWNKRVADAHQDMIVVEPAIGYPASFCNYKVYPSYACLHSFVQDGNLQMNSYHVVIPHYFDVDDFDATQPKEDYFLFVGRLNFDKGITLAIQLTERIGARLKVCGQGNLSSLGYDKIPEHVDFIGYVGVEERKKLMAKAKCLIMPTLYMEPFGCVAIEGMLSGTPILTNDWGGPGENNVHGVTGFKCRTFEQFEWAARNIHLINPKNCREWAEKNFSFDKVGHMYEEYFQSLQCIDWYKQNPSRSNLDHLTKHYPTAVARKIPYNLFQTFETKDISPALQTFLDSWKERNPQYKYIFHDSNDRDQFMKEFDIRAWKAYRRLLPGAFKADLWRCCVLYKYGGVYADIDMVCLGKIDDFLNETTEFVLADNLDEKLLCNAFIAAPPGSEILRECIDRMVKIVETDSFPEDRGYFACGTIANCVNKFMGLDENSTFSGKCGWHGNLHLLHYDTDDYVKDSRGNILFCNRTSSHELSRVYMEELNRLQICAWGFTTDTITDDPLTVYQWDNKIRLGIQEDGGYVIADGLAKYDAYISAGVSCEESFTRDFINTYHMNESNSFAFDGTVQSYPWEYTTDVSFVRKNISTMNDNQNTNLDTLLSRHKDAFLKMDIEGSEWKWIHYTNYLKNIKQMVVEFHGVYDDCWHGTKNNLPPGFTYECFEKIAETHYLVHIHGNTGGGSVNGLPNVVELTYVRRDNHVLEKNTHSFPVKGLDFPNGQNDREFSLKNKPYVNA